LLNIGSEDGKGNAQVKEANKFLQEGPFNYIGYVEGDDIYSDKVDVVVCDGFVGNVSLKTMEGVAKMIAAMMRDEFNRSILSKLAGLVAWPVLSRFKKRVDPRMYNGASMLGLTGIVIKSHGSADVLSYANAIEIALLEVEKRVPEHIRECMEPLMGHAEEEQTGANQMNSEEAKMDTSNQEKSQLESQA
jgi:glycerol-3-phosphate acyltransferase PlsX